jgi:hypothetical protein
MWKRAPKVVKIAICVVAAMLIFTAAQGIEVGRESRWTCAFCRMGKVEKTWMFWNRTRLEPTGFTRWFDRHLDLPHEHNWVSSSCTVTYNVWGLPWRVGCERGDPMFLIDPEGEVAIFEILQRHGKAKAVAQALGRGTRRSRRPMVLALRELDAGSNFQAWWAKNGELFEPVD